MNFFEIVRFAIRGLWTNRLRSGLTTLGIVIGVSSVIILIAVGNGTSKVIQASIDRLGTNSIQITSGDSNFGPQGNAIQNNTMPLTVGDAASLINPLMAPDVKQVAPVKSSDNSTCVNGIHQTSPATFSGTWPAYFEATNTAIAAGAYFSNNDVTLSRRVAIIGRTTSNELFGSENPVGRRIVCDGIPFTVIGVTAQKGSTGFKDGDSLFLTPLTTFENSISGYGPLDVIVVQANSAKATNAAQIEIQNILDTRHSIRNPDNRDYLVFNQTSLLAASTSSSNVFTILLGLVAAISLLVGGIGITNIMLVTVVERTREIGIRKALGASKRAILTQFLIEATILSLVGGLLGVLVGFLGTNFQILSVKPVIVPYSIFLAFGVSVLIGLFFGSYPASRAASLRPIDALHYE